VQSLLDFHSDSTAETKHTIYDFPHIEQNPIKKIHTACTIFHPRSFVDLTSQNSINSREPASATRSDDRNKLMEFETICLSSSLSESDSMKLWLYTLFTLQELLDLKSLLKDSHQIFNFNCLVAKRVLVWNEFID
jgi:hypothetical protein